MACRCENNVPFAGQEQALTGRAIYWNEVLYHMEGEYPRVRARAIPRPCMHCDNPPCVKVCPVGATYRNEEGLVLQRYERCIGCRYCTVACPYTARSFNWYRPEYPESLKQYLNPDVPLRTKGIVEKCTFCVQRIEKAKKKAEAEGRALRDGEVIPACVQACPTGARTFGDLDDPDSRVSQLAESPRAFRLQEELGTRPKVIYLMEGDWDETR